MSPHAVRLVRDLIVCVSLCIITRVIHVITVHLKKLLQIFFFKMCFCLARFYEAVETPRRTSIVAVCREKYE